MEKFIQVAGTAAPLLAANIDTDVIMPKQFLKGVDRSGLVRGVFHDLRFDESGNRRPEFILNSVDWSDARFLVVGPNFGCGSSREHAVWGLLQYGVRALIGTSYGGIFADNCARNGLLALSLPPQRVDQIARCISSTDTKLITIDLYKCSIALADGNHIPFDIDARRRTAFLRGLDLIEDTLQMSNEIRHFERLYLNRFPWLKGIH